MKNEKLKCEVKNVIGILKKTIEKYLNVMKGVGGIV